MEEATGAWDEGETLWVLGEGGMRGCMSIC